MQGVSREKFRPGKEVRAKSQLWTSTWAIQSSSHKPGGPLKAWGGGEIGSGLHFQKDYPELARLVLVSSKPLPSLIPTHTGSVRPVFRTTCSASRSDSEVTHPGGCGPTFTRQPSPSWRHSAFTVRLSTLGARSLSQSCSFSASRLASLASTSAFFLLETLCLRPGCQLKLCFLLPRS